MKGKNRRLFFLLLAGSILPQIGFSNSSAQKAFDAFEKNLSDANYQTALLEVDRAIELSRSIDDPALRMQAYLGKSMILYVFNENDKSLAYSDSALSVLADSKFSYWQHLKLRIETDLIRADALLSKGDIEEAKAAYTNAASLLHKNELNHPKLYARLLLGQSKYHGFKQELKLEFHYAKIAYDLMEKLDVDDLFKVDLIIQYANAFKVTMRDSGDRYEEVYKRVRILYQNALHEAEKITQCASIQKANALHGLANSYADYLNQFPFKSNKDRRACFNSAKNLYFQALRIKNEIYGSFSSSYAKTCYTLALLNQSMDYTDSTFFWYDKAISSVQGPCGLMKGGADRLCCHPKDPYLLNVLYANKEKFLNKLSKIDSDPKILLELYNVDLHRIQLWREVYRTFRSKDLGKIIAQWGHAPFEEAIGAAYRLFKLYGDSTYLHKIFEFAEESKNNDFIFEYRTHRKIQNIGEEPTPRLVSLRELKTICRNTESTYFHVTNTLSNENLAFAIMITADKIHVHPFCSDSAMMFLHQYRHSVSISDCNLFVKASVGLYHLVFEPMFRHIGSATKNMVITPGALFQDISIENILTQPPTSIMCDFRKLDYMMKSFNISYALSGSIWAYQLKQSSKVKGGLVVYKPGLRNKTRLLFSESLFDYLAAKYEGLFLGKDQATREAFLRDTTTRNIVHVFSHAKSDRNQYENSVIYFDGQPSDSVTIADIYNHRLRSQVTILACCESGYGPENYGEGPKSLARAFIFSGSRSVLGTLWNVDEKATVDVLRNFYDRLEKSTSTSEALRQAKLDYLSNCSSANLANPFYWSGLIPFGSIDSDTILIDKRPNIPLYITAGIIGLALITWGGIRMCLKIRY